MPSRVMLTVKQGNRKGQEFVFDHATRMVVGRAEDCTLRLNGDEPIYGMVSRHHCLLDVNPPEVRVRDLGSRHGTYVNGEKIGQREQGQAAEEAIADAGPVRELADGDEVQVWPVVLEVRVLSADRRPPCLTLPGAPPPPLL
jgi:eukaryotic-like serine/threonine-protein kinase